jgi:MFS family permease
MFTGITGVYEVCASLTGAIASVGTPFIARHLPYNTSTAICTLSTALAYLISTLPHPLEGDGTPKSKAAPVIGTMFGGFVYAFGTNIYMAAAAFFPPEAVLALSIGSGFGIIAGPALYTGIMAAFDNDWRRTFLVLLCTPPLMELTWRLTDPGCRAAAEKSRVDSLVKDRMLNQSREPRDQGGLTPSQQEAAGSDSYDSPTPAYFGPHRSRVGFVIKVIFPRYVLPLIFCTSSAIVTLLGTTPTLQTVESFKDAPGGDLQFQYSCE